MISGLNYLHLRRIIHRDIKLHNLMLDERGRCKLIDFGLAKRVKNWKTPEEIEIKIETPRAPEEDEEKFSSSIGTKLFSSP
jgi:serine/threonine protein kinase